MRIALEPDVTRDDSRWRKLDIELAVIADEIPGLDGSERRCIVVKRQAMRLVHCANSSTELFQRC